MKRRQAALALILGGAVVSCTPDWARQNETGLIMEIARVQSGGTGATTGTASDFILSDISNFQNDNALLTVNVFRKNPTVASTSALEHVRLERYEVRFTRSDGRNVEGVDVPFRTTGPLNLRFHTPTGTEEVEQQLAIVLVRQQAKIEPPLRNLVGVFGQPITALQFSGPGVITTTAEITLHAAQVVTGEGLTASARVPVIFADFAATQ
jgi:hypothetical protein